MRQRMEEGFGIRNYWGKNKKVKEKFFNRRLIIFEVSKSTKDTPLSLRHFYVYI
jgi:hypothetical protein